MFTRNAASHQIEYTRTRYEAIRQHELHIRAAPHTSRPAQFRAAVVYTGLDTDLPETIGEPDSAELFAELSRPAQSRATLRSAAPRRATLV